MKEFTLNMKAVNSDRGAALLQDWLPAHTQFDTIVSFIDAVPNNDRLYITGGAVRDFFMGKDPNEAVDLDFVYTGQRSTFLSGDKITQPRTASPFGSFTLLLADSVFADVAFPDSFPCGDRSPHIDQLLLMREHNINGMAVNCCSTQLHDPAGGVIGISEKRVHINEAAWHWLPGHAAEMQLDRLFSFLEKHPGYTVENWQLVTRLAQTGIFQFLDAQDSRADMVRYAKYNKLRQQALLAERQLSLTREAVDV